MHTTANTSLTTSPSTPTSNGPSALPAPGAVTAARVVLGLHGLLIVGLGAALMNTTAVPQGLAIASIVEGVLRIALAFLLRRGARGVRRGTVVVCAIGAGAAAMNMPFGIVGIALNVAIVRCLNTDDSKEFLAA